MLITSLDTGRWVLPKGRVEPLEPFDSAAEREAWEEAGLEGVIDPQALGFYDYEKQLSAGAMQLCRVTVFAMKVILQRETWPERDRRTTRWYSVQEAAAAINEDELRKLILALNPR